MRTMKLIGDVAIWAEIWRHLNVHHIIIMGLVRYRMDAAVGVVTHDHVPYARACVRVLVAPTSACTRTIIDVYSPYCNGHGIISCEMWPQSYIGG